jgi:TonB family protein
MSRCTLIVVIGSLLVSSGLAQDRSELGKRIKAQLQGKSVVIRGFYDESVLNYDQNGHIKGEVNSGPWTLLGYVRIDSCHLGQDKLKLEGQRQFVKFEGDTNKRKPHESNGPNVTIEVDAPPDASEQALLAALQNVFLTSSEQLTDIAPAYWQSFLRGVKPTELKESLEGAEVKKVGGGVHAPFLRFSPDPDYNAVAKAMRFEGKIVLSGVVDRDGWMKQMQIVSPVGLGLDERGIAAAQTWRFDPATKDGKPVPVRIAIEINFHLY